MKKRTGEHTWSCVFPGFPGADSRISSIGASNASTEGATSYAIEKISGSEAAIQAFVSMSSR